MIPANPKNMRSSPMLLDWKTTQDRVSWSVILLLGGGFAMASGCEKSGLSYLIGDSLHVMSELPHSLITVIVCLFSMFLTEFMTNTAAVTILLPVIKEMVSSCLLFLFQSMKSFFPPPSRLRCCIWIHCRWCFRLQWAVPMHSCFQLLPVRMQLYSKRAIWEPKTW